MTKPGNKPYQVLYASLVVKKHIPALSEPIRQLIERAITDKLATDPMRYGKPLRYSLSGHRVFRVGRYRILFRLASESHTLFIVGINHRRDAYR